jgi:prevent-host-death family protein
MTIRTVSVSEFKARCLDVIRQVERDGAAVDLVRRGKVVARLIPSAPALRGTPTWIRLRGRGRLDARPGESVLDMADFDAHRGTVG